MTLVDELKVVRVDALVLNTSLGSWHVSHSISIVDRDISVLCVCDSRVVGTRFFRVQMRALLPLQALAIAGRQDHFFLLDVVFELEIVDSFSFGLDQVKLGPVVAEHAAVSSTFFQSDRIMPQY